MKKKGKGSKGRGLKGKQKLKTHTDRRGVKKKYVGKGAIVIR